MFMAKRQKKQWFKRGVWWRKIRLNRKHKDRLFHYLFQDKKYLLDLYNALHDSSYTDPDALEMVTMKDVIFMKMNFPWDAEAAVWNVLAKSSTCGGVTTKNSLASAAGCGNIQSLKIPQW